MEKGGNEMIKRCDWAQKNQLEMHYHDNEWGVPVHDDKQLFEMLILESVQSGLSWSTVLHKREGYRQAFDNFDVHKVAQYGEDKVALLNQDKGIIRNKLKIKATINNAACFIEIQKQYGSFDDYIWSFVGGEPIQNGWQTMSEVPTSTPESEKMSQSLRSKGFKFIGPTSCYAYMQATGMVNDHLISCFRFHEVKAMSQRNTIEKQASL